MMTGSQKTDILLALYQDSRTIFRLSDVAMLTGDIDSISLGKKLHYYVKTGKLHRTPRKITSVN